MIDHWEILDLYKALFALGAGLVLGLERELKDKSAGLKTITVICLGSALFTMLSYKIGEDDQESTRIASYIVSGIGFIGAGVIFKDKIDVSGLTTAGIIWLSAAVGMAIGFGEFFLALTFMGAAMLILFASRWINKLVKPARQSRDLVFELDRRNLHQKEKILADISREGIKLEEKKLEAINDRILVSVEVTIPTRKMGWMEAYLINHEHIPSFSF
jgi:putative Mg2+ transporter-C (MgtC) family protein